MIALLLVAVPPIMLLGIGGALAKRSSIAPLRWFGNLYTTMVRGVPEILFFLFVPIALDQLIELTRHKRSCAPIGPNRSGSGNDFIVCDAAKAPSCHRACVGADTYALRLWLGDHRLLHHCSGRLPPTFIDGALRAVPKGQMEAAQAIGMSPRQIFFRIQLPQMWIYALPGLSNLWMILIKATPLLFLLGIEDIVYWARELGSRTKTQFSDYPAW